jgi:ADP-ribose pyrophosphatase YjhB (NUDIX family)
MGGSGRRGARMGIGVEKKSTFCSGSISHSSSSNTIGGMGGDDTPPSHKKRFESVHPSILKDALDVSTTQWITPEWEFPKGHRNFNERDMICALREFEEETGILRDEISIVDNVSPFEEIFIGSDHKSYKYRYFLAIARTEISSVNFQRSEISGMEWKTVEQCCQCIRPYNTEKRRLVCTIDQILRTQILR